MNRDNIGRSSSLWRGEELVTGRSIFGRDLAMPGMLQATTIRSPHPHARLVSLDATAARDLEGVAAVATAADVKGAYCYGIRKADQPVLVAPGDTVKMVGDPVALVAADSLETALKAARLVKVEYEILAPVVDPEKACLTESPLIHQERFQGHYEFTRGDIAQALTSSDLVFEETFHSPRQEHGFLEPEAGMAYLDWDGSVVICAAMHDSYLVQMYVAQTLAVDESKVRPIFPPLGGSFGGKQSPSVHIHLALLTMMTQRPVKMMWSREESLLVHYKRHPVRLRCQMGLNRQGRILGYEVEALYDGGAYTHQSPGSVFWGGMHATGPYHIPNLRVEAKAVYTNNPPSGAFRGQGGPQFTTAIERMIDMAARKLDLDPVEIRRRNAITPGQEPGFGDKLVDDAPVTLMDTIDRALEAAGPPPRPKPEADALKLVGRGIACAMPLFNLSSRPMLNLMGTGAVVEMSRNGRLRIKVDVVEMGQGVTTVLRQIVAHEFNVCVDRVDILVSDTLLTPKSGATVASRSVYSCGNAVLKAAVDLRQRLAEKAGQILGVSAQDIGFESQRAFVISRPDEGLRLEELADRSFVEGVNLTSYGWFVGPDAGAGHSFLTQVADVEVDVQTGEVVVLKLVTAHDAGRVLNPLGWQGQMRGASIQALGWALMEDMPTDKGRLWATSLGDYLMPTSLDAPESMPVAAVEKPFPTGPYGARGAGEHASFACAAAILNAIAAATGADIRQWPATAAQVWRELANRKKC